MRLNYWKTKYTCCCLLCNCKFLGRFLRLPLCLLLGSNSNAYIYWRIWKRKNWNYRAKKRIRKMGHVDIEVEKQNRTFPSASFWAKGLKDFILSLFLPIFLCYLSNWWRNRIVKSQSWTSNHRYCANLAHVHNSVHVIWELVYWSVKEP